MTILVHSGRETHVEILISLFKDKELYRGAQTAEDMVLFWHETNKE